MISVIVFDLGNVLLPFNYETPLKHFNEIKPGLGDKFAHLYKENYHVHRDYESGKISTQDFLSIMTGWLDNTVTGEEFCRIFSEIFTKNEDVISLLPKLKKNYTLCLLSNTSEMHRDYGYRHHDYLKYFDKLFLSFEVGAVKPEKEIYAAVERFTQKPPEEHIFIDDIAEYVEGAKQCGWDGIQFKDYENLIVEFEKRGIIL